MRSYQPDEDGRAPPRPRLDVQESIDYFRSLPGTLMTSTGQTLTKNKKAASNVYEFNQFRELILYCCIE